VVWSTFLLLQLLVLAAVVHWDVVGGSCRCKKRVLLSKMGCCVRTAKQRHSILAANTFIDTL
jgi:hypothetical protein